jgi:hypothetical protein
MMMWQQQHSQPQPSEALGLSAAEVVGRFSSPMAIFLDAARWAVAWPDSMVMTDIAVSS